MISCVYDSLTMEESKEILDYYKLIIPAIVSTYTFFYPEMDINSNKIYFRTLQGKQSWQTEQLYTVYIALPKEYMFIYNDYNEYVNNTLRMRKYEKKYSGN